MKSEIKNMNIPEISVNEVKTELLELYLSVIKNSINLRALPAVMLWGAAGVGKSEAVKQLAAELERVSGKKVTVTDIRLLLFSPVDLRGVPVADSQRKFANWLKPKIFDLPEDSKTVNIIFLDEISAAPMSVQASAYQICLDKQIGEHKLPDNCIIIAAGNRTTDQSVAYKMPAALANRMLHFNVESSFDSWKNWAVEHGIDERIVGYLSFDNSRLYTEPDSSSLAYATPRSWSFVNTIINGCDDIKEKYLLISAAVGIDAALEFEEWCKVYKTLPKVSDIIAGKCSVYPQKHDELYALTASLTRALTEAKETVSVDELENVFIYAKRFPADFAAMFFDNLVNVKELQGKIMKCRSISEWIKQNA